MQNLITDKRFFTLGNATFTVSNATGTHYTYKVSRPDEDKPYFVGLLTGPDNEASYTYMGLLDPNTLQVRLTKASKYNLQSTPYRVINWALGKVAHGTPLPSGYAIQHEGKCGRCGRKLTTPESIERGIGPECWANMAH